MDKDLLTDWLTNVLKGLVTDPASLSVEKVVDELGTKFTVKVGSQDTGRVLGRKGQTAEALRTILRVAGYLCNVRAAMVVDIPGRKFVPKEEENPENPKERPVTSY